MPLQLLASFDSVAATAAGFRQDVLSSIIDPNVALVLVFFGLIAIYAEFSAPGRFLPGALGATAVLLGFTGLSSLPVTWTGTMLLLLSILCYVLEAKYATHGLLTAVGAAMMAWGALALIDSSTPAPKVTLVTAISITLPFAIVSSFLFSIAHRARRNKVLTGREGMIGLRGESLAELKPSGLIRVRGEYWNARSEQEIPVGQPVKVYGIEGLTLLVARVKENL